MAQRHSLGMAEAFALLNNKGEWAQIIARECVEGAVSRDNPGQPARECVSEMEHLARSLVADVRQRMLTSARALAGLMDGVAQVPGPKTIVLLSQELPVGAGLSERKDFEAETTSIARAAAQAQASVYVLQLDRPLVDVDSRAKPGSLGADADMASSGLETVTTLYRRKAADDQRSRGAGVRPRRPRGVGLLRRRLRAGRPRSRRPAPRGDGEGEARRGGGACEAPVRLHGRPPECARRNDGDRPAARGHAACASGRCALAPVALPIAPPRSPCRPHLRRPLRARRRRPSSRPRPRTRRRLRRPLPRRGPPPTSRTWCNAPAMGHELRRGAVARHRHRALRPVHG